MKSLILLNAASTYVIYVEHKKAMYPSFENMVLKMNMIQNNTHYHKLKYVCIWSRHTSRLEQISRTFLALRHIHI